MNHDIPESFRKSVILPLYKKGDINDVSNYRGLSLLNTIYKIFTGIILNRLNHWINFHHILNEYQAGFRKSYSTVDNIFSLTSIVNLNWHENKNTFAFFVDFSCAFDTIPHNSLFYKLSCLGLSSNIISILRLLYTDACSQVWDGTFLPDSFLTGIGVKQGCLLSPILFSLYLNDLHDFLPKGLYIAGTCIRVLMYADDLILLADSSADLQIMINSLREYCALWSLHINLLKSKVMVFRKGARISSSLRWFYGSEEIDIVNE